jgi:hypothetical protein
MSRNNYAETMTQAPRKVEKSMKTSKRVIAGFSALAVTAIALTGCAGSTDKVESD